MIFQQELLDAAVSLWRNMLTAQSHYEDAPIFACNAAITEDLFRALHMIKVY